MNEESLKWLAEVVAALRHRRIWNMLNKPLRQRLLYALRSASYGVDEAVELIDDLDDEIKGVAQEVLFELEERLHGRPDHDGHG